MCISRDKLRIKLWIACYAPAMIVTDVLAPNTYLSINKKQAEWSVIIRKHTAVNLFSAGPVPNLWSQQHKVIFGQ